MEASPHTRRVLVAVLAAGILASATGAASVAASPATAPSSVPSVVNDGVGPQFYSDSVIDIPEDVDGDVYAAGQSITISGDVTGDVIAAAQTITITGNVDGNVRLAGQDVTIDGDVARSGTIFASITRITEEGSFGGDLVGAAEDIVLAGAVGRDVVVGVGSLTIDGQVAGDVTYTSDRNARIADGAVSGTVERVVPPQPRTVEPSPWAMVIGWLLGLLYALVALSLVTACAGLLLPRVLHRVTNQLVPTPWRALLVGFVASIAVPIALVVILVTIIGAPLALAGFLVWLTLTLAAFVHVAYYIGRLLFRGDQPPVVKALVGGVILIVALQIPWLNIAVWVAMVFLGLGAQLLAIYDQRPWRRTRAEAEAAPDAPIGSTPYRGVTQTRT